MADRESKEAKVSPLTQYFMSVSQGPAASLYAESMAEGSLDSSQARGNTDQVQESQQAREEEGPDATEMPGELFGRLAKRRKLKSDMFKAGRKEGMLDSDTKAEYRDIATKAAFEGFGE